MAFYCLVSAFKGVCHLPGNNGFISLVTHELETRCTDSSELENRHSVSWNRASPPTCSYPPTMLGG